MRRIQDTDAISPLVGFIIATVVFSVSFYYVVDSAIRQDPAREDAVEYTAVAQSLADVIMSPGRQWYQPNSCQGGPIPTSSLTPEQVGAASGNPVVYNGRFGIGDENCGKSLTDPTTKNALSFDKFRNLYQSKFQADPANGKVDYQEARRSLGLTGQQLDFHLRSWPVLASVREILGTGQKDPLMRPLYIGDYASTSTAFNWDENRVFTTAQGTDVVEVRFDIENPGSVAATFSVQVEIRLADGTIGFLLYSPSINSGDIKSVAFNLHKSSDFAWKTQGQTPIKEIRYQIWDKNTKLYPSGGSNSWGSKSMDAFDMTNCGGSACAQFPLVFAQADRMYQQLSGGTATMKIWYKAFNGRGAPLAMHDWQLNVEKCAGPSGAFGCTSGEAIQTFPLPNTDSSESFITQAVSTATAYLGLLQTDLGVEYNRVNVNVVAAPPAAFTPAGGNRYVARQAVVAEIGYIDRLIDQFDPYVVNSAYETSAPDPYVVPYDCPAPLPAGCGDVFPDLRDVMNNDLRTALTDASGNPTTTKYTTLFVGSNVDHNAMTSQQAKGTIRDWVFAGGTLIVMGSDDQSVTWLEPIFHAALETGSGGVYTPDQQHAALNVPNQLDYGSYTSSTSWSYNAGAGESFTHVVTQGDADLLGIGNPGAFGLGKVILTSWRAFQLTSNQVSTCPDSSGDWSNCQALFLVQNLVTLSYRELYLDYGPVIPFGVPVGADIRIGSIYHPELNQLLGIQLQIFVFPGGS